MTPAGFAFFDDLGIDLETPRRGRRAFCRPCLDWSERRFHIAGHTGAAIATHCEAQGWIKRVRDSRAVKLSEAGSEALAKLLGLAPARPRPSPVRPPLDTPAPKKEFGGGHIPPTVKSHIARDK